MTPIENMSTVSASEISNTSYSPRMLRLHTRNWIGGRRRDRAAMGLIGACLVLVGEGAASLLMADSREALNTFVTPAGLVGLALVGLAALTPLLLLAWPSSRLR